MWRQDWINRDYLKDEADHPQTLTFDAGIEFLKTNIDADDWYLQIEAFDPHEPFFSYEQYRRLYDAGYEGPNFDWPAYRRVIEDESEVEQLRNEYMALVTMCDNSLGRVLDLMDEHDMWKDTMLIVCTDHGLLLGEHNWWGKNVQPWYDENIHIPLFVWDPRAGVGRRAPCVPGADDRPGPDAAGVLRRPRDGGHAGQGARGHGRVGRAGARRRTFRQRRRARQRH